MPNFYLDVAPTTPLSQGDIFRDFPITMPVYDPLRQLAVAGDGLYESVAVDEGPKAGMSIPATVEELAPVILLTQSCDTRDATRLILAPIRLLQCKPSNLWQTVNDLANTLRSPNRVYLPDEPKFGFPRSYIDLAAPLCARRRDVERLAMEGKRMAALGSDGVGYLQFRLAVLLCRFARDNFAWPSRADLDLKAQDLSSSIEKRKQQLAVEEGKLRSEKTKPEEAEKAETQLASYQTQQERDEEELQQTKLAIAEYDR